MKQRTTVFLAVEKDELLGGLLQISGSGGEARQLLADIVETYRKEVGSELRYRQGRLRGEDVLALQRQRQQHRRHVRLLRRNMRAAGRKQVPRTAAHHIVSALDGRAATARALLSQLGIDINAEANGVYLPTCRQHTPHPEMPSAYAHSIVHTNYYYLNLTSLLTDEMLNGADKLDMESVLRDVAFRLVTGTFPIHCEATLK